MASLKVTPQTLRDMAATLQRAQEGIDRAKQGLSQATGGGHAFGKASLAAKYAQGHQQAGRIVAEVGTTMGDHARALCAVADALDGADQHAAARFRQQ